MGPFPSGSSDPSCMSGGPLHRGLCPPLGLADPTATPTPSPPPPTPPLNFSLIRGAELGQELRALGKHTAGARLACSAFEIGLLCGPLVAVPPSASCAGVPSFDRTQRKKRHAGMRPLRVTFDVFGGVGLAAAISNICLGPPGYGEGTEIPDIVAAPAGRKGSCAETVKDEEGRKSEATRGSTEGCKC